MYYSKIHFAEEGLQKAVSTTEALYTGNMNVLGTLTADDIKDVFTGATICDVLLEPGTTALSLAMKAKCFKNESMYKITNIRL